MNTDVVCHWAQDGEDSETWATSCRKYFNLEDGSPTDNKMAFCCFCGRPIEEDSYEEQDIQRVTH